MQEPIYYCHFIFIWLFSVYCINKNFEHTTYQHWNYYVYIKHLSIVYTLLKHVFRISLTYYVSV
jgi:hypothetical protein